MLRKYAIEQKETNFIVMISLQHTKLLPAILPRSPVFIAC